MYISIPASSQSTIGTIEKSVSNKKTKTWRTESDKKRFVGQNCGIYRVDK